MKRKSNRLFKIIIFVLIVFVVYNLFFKKPSNVDDNEEEFIGYENISSTYTTEWDISSNVGIVEEDDKDSNIRDKYTEIIGDGKDEVTVLVYMCGADLESAYGMASSDLSEMANANLSDKINLIVYTGGCLDWKIQGISNKYNQIFQVIGDEQIGYLSDNAGSAAMVDPNTLTSFIEYGVSNFEADRYALIFWDHGAGSVQGYGKDEKYPNKGSMSLDLIDKALTDADVKFDFIGFDACLMANTETALMLSEHADYLIASEEAEPGIGWYYTDWLNTLSNNTSISTVQLGKSIVDSFIEECKYAVPNQSTTLSVIDLAELEYSLPNALSEFASSTSELIDTSYSMIAKARSNTREFARAQLDLIDLTDLANRVNTKEGKRLSDVLQSCIKYNNTSKDMSNAYGLSIYFPYRAPAYLNTVLNTYDAIDMNEEYSSCIRNFGSYTTGGQLSSGGYSSIYDVFSSDSNFDYSDNYNYQNQSDSEFIFDLLNSFIAGSFNEDDSYSSYYSSGYDYWFDRSMNEDIAKYVSDNHLDANLNFVDGKLYLTNKQWSLIDNLLLNVYIDDGEGYIELGKDNIFDIDDKGNLLAINDMTWLAASIDDTNYEVVPFYYISTLIDGDNLITTGRIPVLLNDRYANLIIRIDNESIDVVGASFDYKDNNSTIAKNITGLVSGDKIEFVCDYYSYDGEFNDTYKLGNPLIINDKLYLNDVNINDNKYLATYQITDIYQQDYYTSLMNN